MISSIDVVGTSVAATTPVDWVTVLAAILGAVVGAIIAGAIAFFLQRQTFRENNRKRERDRQAEREALGHALLIKVSRIYSSANNTYVTLEAPFRHSAEHGVGIEQWQVGTVIANLPDRVYFSSDELSMLFSLNDMALFNSILSLDHEYNGVIGGVEMLNAERRRLQQQLPAPETVSGTQGNLRLDEGTLRSLQPAIIAVDTLTTAVRREARSIVIRSHEAITQLDLVLRAALGLPVKLGIKPPATESFSDEGEGAAATPDIRGSNTTTSRDDRSGKQHEGKN